MPYSVFSPELEQTLNQVNTITTNYFEKTINQIVYEGSLLLRRLKDKDRVTIKGGNQIQWNLRTDKLGTTGAVDPRATVTWSTADTRRAVQLNWKYYYGTTLAQWDELRANKGESKIVDLVKDKLQELKEDFDETLIADLYDTAAQDEMKIESLNTLVGTGTWAGLDPTSLTDPTRWQSIVDDTSDILYIFDNSAQDGTAGNTSTNSLAQILNRATFGSKRPTIIFTTEDIFTGIEAYLEAQRRLTRNENVTKMGYDNIEFKGVPIVADTRMPAGYMYGLDEKELELVVDPDYNFKATPWQPHEDYPNAIFKGMSFSGNLKARTRHTHFKYTNIQSVGNA
jgi:hypothetical protein